MRNKWSDSSDTPRSPSQQSSPSDQWGRPAAPQPVQQSQQPARSSGWYAPGVEPVDDTGTPEKKTWPTKKGLIVGTAVVAVFMGAVVGGTVWHNHSADKVVSASEWSDVGDIAEAIRAADFVCGHNRVVDDMMFCTDDLETTGFGYGYEPGMGEDFGAAMKVFNGDSGFEVLGIGDEQVDTLSSRGTTALWGDDWVIMCFGSGAGYACSHLTETTGVRNTTTLVESPTL